MPHLTLKLLGPFAASLADDHPIQFPTAKAQALLAYLLVAEAEKAGANHQRGQLMTLLWPDTLPESAQTNLRQTLYRLRHVLPEVDLPSGETEPFLLSDRLSVRVNPHAQYRLDISEFERALRLADQQTGEERVASIEQAVSLYQGEFLTDVYVPDSEQFESWAQQVREHARRKALHALEYITDHAQSRGDFTRAQEAARQQIAIDELHESAYHQLMIALASSGQRSEALAEYEKLNQLLADQLDLDPSNETVALAEALKSDDFKPEVDRQLPITSQFETPERQAELILLDKVDRFWIQGVLDPSLHGAQMVVLRMESAPSTLAYPWDIIHQGSDPASHHLLEGMNIAEIFERSGHALLILGEPGSGKTTMLLELARHKIDEAGLQPAVPLPVVFNLTSWADRRLPIQDWLVEELQLKYLIPARIGRSWVEAGRLLLLLDGLDEVQPGVQTACVSAINIFRQDYGLAQIAVCSRAQDYEALPEKLQLDEAVQLQPIDLTQAQQFLHENGGSLGEVAEMLAADPEFAALAQSPLMLGIISLAYRDATAGELASLKSARDRREHLFAMYVENMFLHRGRRTGFSPGTMKGFLASLARSLIQHDQSVFLLEQLQPDWLANSASLWLYTISTRLVVSLLLAVGFITGFASMALNEVSLSAVGASLLTSLILGLLLGILVALSYSRAKNANQEIIRRGRFWRTLARVVAVGILAFAVTTLTFQLFGFSLDRATGVGYGNALVFGLMFGLRGRNRSIGSDIRPVETIRWSWEGALRASLPGLVVGVGLGLLDQYVTDSTGQTFVILVFAALGALMTGLIGGLQPGVVDTKARPNEGLRLSLRYGIRIGLVFALASTLVFSLIFNFGANLNIALLPGLLFALRVGLTLGLMALLWYGGIEILHHEVLRFLLRQEGDLPNNLPAFLDYAVDLIFLRRIGGGYIFVHHLLQDYFARRL